MNRVTLTCYIYHEELKFEYVEYPCPTACGQVVTIMDTHCPKCGESLEQYQPDLRAAIEERVNAKYTLIRPVDYPVYIHPASPARC